MCLPHFIIGGVPKAGTTALYSYRVPSPNPSLPLTLTKAGTTSLYSYRVPSLNPIPTSTPNPNPNSNPNY